MKCLLPLVQLRPVLLLLALYCRCCHCCHRRQLHGGDVGIYSEQLWGVDRIGARRFIVI
jgi:hypothetical protein